MPVSALAMVIVAALLHAFWNIVAKKTGGNRHFVLMGGLLLALIWAPAGLWLGWQQVPHWGWLQWAFVSASGFMHLAYFKVLLKGYREIEDALKTSARKHCTFLSIDVVGSTQMKRRWSCGPRSPIVAASAAPGFHTTVSAKPC